ncbi:unnamed protein product [Peronospora farinosa]|nr:unnamed protein product [Peronospora farinosa]
MLTHHFESDHALASALVQGKGEIAEELKNMQVETWVKNEENEEGVFELLQLDKTNPFQDPIASQWFNFIEKKYNSPEEPYKVLDIVLSYFKTGMNGLMGALVGAIDAPSTKIIVQKLLDLQFKKWREEGKDAADVYKILNLHQIEKPFDSPVLRAWIYFIKLTPLNPDNTAKTGLSVLKLVYNENLDQVLP